VLSKSVFSQCDMSDHVGLFSYILIDRKGDKVHEKGHKRGTKTQAKKYWSSRLSEKLEILLKSLVNLKFHVLHIMNGMKFYLEGLRGLMNKKNQFEDTNPGRLRNWRATTWEIHPITGAEVR
jgi:hypothetical protein